MHGSEDGESDGEDDFESRAVDRLVQEAQLHADDGHDVPDLPNAIPYQYIAGGMSYRGGWITTADGEGEEEEKLKLQRLGSGTDGYTDEQDNMLESKTRSLTTQSARNVELATGYASSGSEPPMDGAATARQRKSPSVGVEAGPRRKKAKLAEPATKQSAGLRELTCRELLPVIIPPRALYADTLSMLAAICNRTWQGSEAAMSGHVDKCLAELEKVSKKKKPKQQKQPSSKKVAPMQSTKAKSQSIFGMMSGEGKAPALARR